MPTYHSRLMTTVKRRSLRCRTKSTTVYLVSVDAVLRNILAQSPFLVLSGFTCLPFAALVSDCVSGSVTWKTWEGNGVMRLRRAAHWIVASASAILPLLTNQGMDSGRNLRAQWNRVRSSRRSYLYSSTKTRTKNETLKKDKMTEICCCFVLNGC